jgi:hypothetical protein
MQSLFACVSSVPGTRIRARLAMRTNRSRNRSAPRGNASARLNDRWKSFPCRCRGRLTAVVAIRRKFGLTPVTLHGVVFDILDGSESCLRTVQSVFAFARLTLRPSVRRGLPGHSSRAQPAFALWASARQPSLGYRDEGWWACLDSNQEPDRYERPALTIELQAPPRAAAREGGAQRCRHRLQADRRSGNAAAGGNPRDLIQRTLPEKSGFAYKQACTIIARFPAGHHA